MITLTPAWASYRRYLVAIVPAVLVLLVIEFVRYRSSLPLLGALLGGTLVLVAICLALYFRNYRISAELHLLELWSWLGVHRTLGPDQLDRVVLVHNYTENGVTVPFLIVLDRDGKRVLKLGGRFWTLAQMTELAGTLSIPVDTLDTQRPVDLRRRYPRAVSYVSAHPYVSGFLLAMGVVAALVIGVVLFVAATYSD